MPEWEHEQENRDLAFKAMGDIPSEVNIVLTQFDSNPESALIHAKILCLKADTLRLCLESRLDAITLGLIPDPNA